ncbi:hypothetical protein NGM37_40365, partial [Streptomyces sp. TRM76130]|nr:hypothetical protein [Streptomyces sp. TRM76130]
MDAGGRPTRDPLDDPGDQQPDIGRAPPVPGRPRRRGRTRDRLTRPRRLLARHGAELVADGG